MIKLDDTDYQILEALKEDGRATYSEIATEVHLSRVAVKDRITSMTNNGIIVGYTVQINAKAYNKCASVYLDIEVDPKLVDDVAFQLSQLEEIAIISQHTGASGLHVHAFIDSLEGLSNFLKNEIYPIHGVRKVNSDLLLKHYKMNVYLTNDECKNI